ncbi:MAG: hypothetical protein RIS82_1031 [Actinomycetota bacterium]|jgi:primosomal protein N' (replication factor Y)
MTKFGVARVTIDSPLPQLDRLFDYQIPEELADAIVPGVRVKVPFGRSKSLHDGFVVSIQQAPEFQGKLAELAEVVSEAVVLAPEIYSLVRAVADRQAATASDVLRLAVPTRSVAVEKKWLSELSSVGTIPPAKSPAKPFRATMLVSPVTTEAGPNWAVELVDQAIRQAESGFSSILIVPDYRDQAVLAEMLTQTQFANCLLQYSSDQKNSAKYSHFLRCHSQPVSIVVGSRSAVYAPVRNLGLIAIWDDGDQSHQEPSSPYSHSREVALIRQRQSGCSILFAGHARSTEIQRLVEIGYLTDQTSQLQTPEISTADRDVRLDGSAWAIIREALKHGSVLVQVSSRGNAVSAYCSTCAERACCFSCNGPLWLDTTNQVRCRWCNQSNLNFRCKICGGQKVKAGGAGSTRTASDFGKAFPGIPIIESNAEHRKESINATRSLVVATPGAEPRVAGGYQAVVVLDANHALNRDSLKATEDAFRSWANAIAMVKPQGQALVVGIKGQLAKFIASWQPASFAHVELESRRELRFPPAIRMASISAESGLLDSLLAELRGKPGVEVLGPMAIYDRNVLVTWRALVKYDFAQGEWLANHLKAAVLVHSAGASAVNAKSGRAMRPIRVKMDDSEVI